MAQILWEQQGVVHTLYTHHQMGSYQRAGAATVRCLIILSIYTDISPPPCSQRLSVAERITLFSPSMFNTA